MRTWPKTVRAKGKDTGQKKKGVGVGRVYSYCNMGRQASGRHFESTRWITVLCGSDCGMQLRREDKYCSMCSTGVELEGTSSLPIANRALTYSFTFESILSC